MRLLIILISAISFSVGAMTLVEDEPSTDLGPMKNTTSQESKEKARKLHHENKRLKSNKKGGVAPKPSKEINSEKPNIQSEQEAW